MTRKIIQSSLGTYNLNIFSNQSANRRRLGNNSWCTIWYGCCGTQTNSESTNNICGRKFNIYNVRKFVHFFYIKKDDPSHKSRFEDDIIAWTWDKFIKTNGSDPTILLQSPMTKVR